METRVFPLPAEDIEDNLVEERSPAGDLEEGLGEDPGGSNLAQTYYKGFWEYIIFKKNRKRNFDSSQCSGRIKNDCLTG